MKFWNLRQRELCLDKTCGTLWNCEEEAGEKQQRH